MNDEYLERANEAITDKMILVNVASKRARELARGSSPLVKTQHGEGWLDIALHEIADKKIVIDASDKE